MTQTRITSYCAIKPGKVILNGEVLLEAAAAPYGEFIRSAYKSAGMSYPKFYKMDDLCKLALVSSELLLKDHPVQEVHGKEQTGLIIQNASSTYDTDSTYQTSIDDRNNYFPSPAVFVYTLPNIMLGEICIKHKIFGENALLISPVFDAPALVRHASLLFESNRMTACITGWVEQRNEQYEAFLVLAETTGEAGPVFNAENLENIYQSIV